MKCSELCAVYWAFVALLQDYAKARNYFTLAADQGWVDGQLQLGIMYYSKSSSPMWYILQVISYTIMKLN